MTTNKLPINLTNLQHQRTIEREGVEYKAGWNPESIMHTLSAFANDFYNFGDGYVVTRLMKISVYRVVAVSQL